MYIRCHFHWLENLDKKWRLLNRIWLYVWIYSLGIWPTVDYFFGLLTLRWSHFIREAVGSNLSHTQSFGGFSQSFNKNAIIEFRTGEEQFFLNHSSVIIIPFEAVQCRYWLSVEISHWRMPILFKEANRSSPYSLSVCVSFSMFPSETLEPSGRFSTISVWSLCHYGLFHLHTLQYSAVSNNITEDARTCEMETILAQKI
jgi:hypothetical protein